MNFDMQDNTLLWYAIHVKSNHERITARALSGKGYEPFVPIYRESGDCGYEWQRKVKSTLHAPVFPGYIFCRFDVRQRLPLLTTPGVVRIVGTGKVPLPVDPEEMASIHALTQSDLRITPYAYPPVGERIRLERGPLSGVEGVIVAHKSKDQLVVSATILQRSVAIDVERSWLRPPYAQISA